MKEALYIAGFGVYISKKQELFIIKTKDKKDKIPARHIDKIVFLGPAKSISIDAIALAIKHRIPIFFAYSTGHPYAMVFPTIAVGTVRTRRLQYEAYTNETGVELAKAFIKGKLMNQYTLLKFFWKSRKRTNTELAEQIKQHAEQIRTHAEKIETIKAERITPETRQKIMNIEAKAADIYWEAYAKLIPKPFTFEKRDKPNAEDPINALLNLGYSLLFMEVAREIIYSGLDPYAGFLHADRSGRESLILDAMEEFRQWTVDRTVIKLLTIKKLRPKDITNENNKLTQETIKEFIAEFEKQLNTEILNMQRKKKTIQKHIAHQAEAIKRHILKTETYQPCIFVW